MKLSDLKNLNETVSSLKDIANELAAELKHSDEGKEANIKVSNTDASFEILIKDWGDVLDSGASDFDDHKNHLNGERALHGFVNKYSTANPKLHFTVKYFDEGNYYHVDIKNKIAESADYKGPLADAEEQAVAAFKASSHGKGFSDKDFKSKSIKNGKVITAFDWGFWRENEHGSGMTVSLKTESDVKEIVKKLQAKFDKEFKKAISIDADLEDQSLVITLKQERPVTEFI
jgi:hypothetical protein